MYWPIIEWVWLPYAAVCLLAVGLWYWSFFAPSSFRGVFTGDWFKHDRREP